MEGTSDSKPSKVSLKIIRNNETIDKACKSKTAFVFFQALSTVTTFAWCLGCSI
ncbi:unnamed protein product [Arabidopsis halleri]